MMMFEMFGALHREQYDAIRQELDQLRQINTNLQELQVQLLQAQAVKLPPPVEAPEVPADPPPADVRPAVARQAGPGPGPPRGGPSARSATPDIHSTINRRIAELHRERDGRWQRLVQAMGRLLPDSAP